MSEVHEQHVELDDGNSYFSVDLVLDLPFPTIRIIALPGVFRDSALTDTLPLQEIFLSLNRKTYDAAYAETCVISAIEVFLSMYLLTDISMPVTDFLDIFDDVRYFARYIYENAEVPIKRSPLHGEYLRTIVKNSGPAISVYLGTIAAGYNPLVAVIVASGSVIAFGVSKGIADALEQGLHLRLLQAMGIAEPIRRVRRDQSRVEKRDE